MPLPPSPGAIRIATEAREDRTRGNPCPPGGVSRTVSRSNDRPEPQHPNDVTHARPFRAALAALLLPLAAACAAAVQPGTAPAPGSVSDAEFEALFRARADSARMRYTAADVRFMTTMIHHHAQALEMANLVPERTGNRQVRTLAGRIHNAQTDEIRTMQTWLRDRGEPVPELHEMDGQVMVHGPGEHAHHAMPGMLTPAQLAELRGMRGAAFDRRFLERMIQHHQGAVEMVRELFATDGAGQDEDAFRLATDVQVDQITEVRRMELMLAALPAGGEP